jgi:hypothetical protein
MNNPMPSVDFPEHLTENPPEIVTSEIIIKGITSSGREFRPSDWSDRISGVLSTFGADHRMSYSPYVKPVTVDGVRCVIVDKKLQKIASSAYNFLISFAHDNDLQIADYTPPAANDQD